MPHLTAIARESKWLLMYLTLLVSLSKSSMEVWGLSLSPNPSGPTKITSENFNKMCNQIIKQQFDLCSYSPFSVMYIGMLLYLSFMYVTISLIP